MITKDPQLIRCFSYMEKLNDHPFGWC